MSAGDRLTAEQLATLVPGDSVTIEASGDFRRPRRTSGTVVRVEGSYLVVSARSPQGVCYIQHYSRRDGVRTSGGGPAQLVNGAAVRVETTEDRRQMLQIDALFREWSRHRGDVDRLRQLYDAIRERLEESEAEPAQ